MLKLARSSRSWVPAVAGRLSRYESTVSSSQSPLGRLHNAPPSSPKSLEVPTSAGAALSTDEEAQLQAALLRAIQDIKAEDVEEAPLTVEGYDGPIFDANPPPNSKYDPADLPLVQDLSQSYREISEEEWSATLVHGRSSQAPVYHTPVYKIPVANLHFRSYHPKLLDFFCHFASHAAASLGIPISKTAHLPTQRSLWTVPRSPFAHKKSQENFDRRTHKRGIKAWDADPEVVERWCQYLRTHAMAGVGVKVTRWHRLPLGFGAANFASLKDQLAVPRLPAEQIKELGERIVQREMSSSTPKSQEAVSAP